MQKIQQNDLTKFTTTGCAIINLKISTYDFPCFLEDNNGSPQYSAASQSSSVLLISFGK